MLCALNAFHAFYLLNFYSCPSSTSAAGAVIHSFVSRDAAVSSILQVLWRQKSFSMLSRTPDGLKSGIWQAQSEG